MESILRKEEPMFLWPGEKNVLRVLSRHEWMYGYDIVKTSSKGRWSKRVRRGVVYVWLSRLIEKKLVEVRYQNDDEWRVFPAAFSKRRLFRITSEGRVFPLFH